MTTYSINKVKIWWRAIRYHFVPPSIFPAVLGGIISWANGTFYPWLFLIVIAAIIMNHVALNMADDYFDYKHSVDKLKPGEKNPYTGGSGTLSSGELAPRNMFQAFILCFFITISLGLFLTAERGLPILALGLFGVFCAVFYTAPPINFSHHGLGELALLVNFGSVIGLGAYFVQAQSLTIEAFLATLPMGIMLFSMIVINEIPDIEEDRRAGKLTLVARFGRKAGVKLYIASWICTYTIIAGSVLFLILPVFALLALVSAPLVYLSIKTLRQYYEDPLSLAPANLNMIRAHSVASFGLIGGYAVQGVIHGADVVQLIFVILLLFVVYFPVALMLVRKQKHI
jgi:1,4-dihydroxy-2-naphthoate octaprenyltransferase